jgi:hypothetical protein
MEWEHLLPKVLRLPDGIDRTATLSRSFSIGDDYNDSFRQAAQYSELSAPVCDLSSLILFRARLQRSNLASILRVLPTRWQQLLVAYHSFSTRHAKERAN